MSTNGSTTDEDNLMENYLATSGGSPSTPPLVEPDGEVTDVDPDDATQLDILAAQQDAPPSNKKRKKHKAMSAQEQINTISSLQQRLAAFQNVSSDRIGISTVDTSALPGAANEGRTVGDSSQRSRKPSVASVKTEEDPFDSTDTAVDSAMDLDMSTSPTSVIPFTSPQSATRFEAPAQLFYTVLGKTRKRSRKEERVPLPKEYEDMQSIIATLNAFGTPREQDLTTAMRRAVALLEMQGEDGRKMTGELKVLAMKWNDANRAHLKTMVTFLEHNGVIGIGGVVVPSDAIVLD